MCKHRAQRKHCVLQQVCLPFTFARMLDAGHSRNQVWIAAGGGAYILACFFLRVKELDTIKKTLLRRS